MGKKDKGVLLDNGKKAQSSMALYWQNNKQRSKAPKQKKQKQLTMEEDLDQRAVTGFQKWKLHKEKMISKSYMKKQDKNDKNQQKEKYRNQQNDQDDIMEQNNFQENKNKEINIPGYGKKEKLISKLQSQKVPEADQSTNILKVPAQYGTLSQDDIIQLLRAKKRKEQFVKKKQQKPKREQQQDIILGQDLYQRKKIIPTINAQIKDKEEQKPLIQPQPQQQKVFFKSNILNDLSKGKKFENLTKQPIQTQKKESLQKIQMDVQNKQQNNTNKPHIQIKHSGFIPRALRK